MNLNPFSSSLIFKHNLKFCNKFLKLHFEQKFSWYGLFGHITDHIGNVLVLYYVDVRHTPKFTMVTLKDALWTFKQWLALKLRVRHGIFGILVWCTSPCFCVMMSYIKLRAVHTVRLRLRFFIATNGLMGFNVSTGRERLIRTRLIRSST